MHMHGLTFILNTIIIILLPKTFQQTPQTSIFFFPFLSFSFLFFSTKQLSRPSKSPPIMARALRCDLNAAVRATKPSPASSRRSSDAPAQVPARILAETDQSAKIVLQPRVCTLRSYGTDPFAVVKAPRRGGDSAASAESSSSSSSSPFFEVLSEYIESSKKSQDFEIISGRLAMIVFAATVTTELVTGSSLFGKVDLQGIEEAAGASVAAVALAAAFAWFTSARARVGRIFTGSCNAFIDGLIDQIVDGLFFDSGESGDWPSDDV